MLIKCCSVLRSVLCVDDIKSSIPKNKYKVWHNLNTLNAKSTNSKSSLLSYLDPAFCTCSVRPSKLPRPPRFRNAILPVVLSADLHSILTLGVLMAPSCCSHSVQEQKVFRPPHLVQTEYKTSYKIIQPLNFGCSWSICLLEKLPSGSDRWRRWRLEEAGKCFSLSTIL